MNIDNLNKYLNDIQRKLTDLDKLENIKIEEDDFNKLSSSIQELGLVTQEISFKNEVKEENKIILDDLSKIISNTQNIKSEIQSNSKKITDLVDSNNNLTQKNLKIVWDNIKEEINKSNTLLKNNIESNKDEIIKTLKSDISTLKSEISLLKTNIDKNITETRNLKEEIGKQVGTSKTGIIEEIKKIFKKPEPLANNLPNTNKLSENNNSGNNTQNGN